MVVPVLDLERGRGTVLSLLPRAELGMMELELGA